MREYGLTFTLFAGKSSKKGTFGHFRMNKSSVFRKGKIDYTL